jgi:polysaccharide export outer membrane protein
MSVRPLLALAIALTLTGCASNQIFGSMPDVTVADAGASSGYPEPVPPPASVAYGEALVMPAALKGPHAVADADGPYLLDSGDRLRVFVYGQPNLSRVYTIDHGGMITVPLIGAVKARGATTFDLERTIRSRLGAKYVRDPQVSVDIQQNRPFFILGEVKNAGQYPYVSGMTVETAVAIAGGYTDRASTRSFRITRRINGLVEQIDAPAEYVVQAGDTVNVFERLF